MDGRKTTSVIPYLQNPCTCKILRSLILESDVTRAALDGMEKKLAMSVVKTGMNTATDRIRYERTKLSKIYETKFF